MTRVLVTGGTGFVGRHVVRELAARRWEIHVAGRSVPSNTSDGCVTFHACDLLEQAEARRLVDSIGATHLIHLAWESRPGLLYKTPANLAWQAASENLYNAFAQSGGKRVVFAGTCAECDWKQADFAETATISVGDTLYGKCKHALHRIVQSTADSLGIKATWGRMFFMYGPAEREQRLLSSAIRSLLCGRPFRCLHGNQVRDYLHVHDAANALVHLLESDLQGTVNIGSGIPVRLKEIVTTVARKLRREDLVQLPAAPTANADATFVVAQIGRLTRQLGWRPSFDLDCGLDHTIRWWKRNLQLTKSNCAA